MTSISQRLPENWPHIPGLTPASPKPAAPPSMVRQLVRLPIRLLEETGKLVLHYPAWFYVPALLGRLEWFLVPYVLAHALYLGRSGLVVLVKLGR